MRTLQNLFIACLYEHLNAIPHEITFKLLESFDNSEALRKFDREREMAFSTTNMIHASTIDDAIKAIEDIADSFMECKLTTEEKDRQKAQNKAIGENVKRLYCDWLCRQGISVV